MKFVMRFLVYKKYVYTNRSESILRLDVSDMCKE